MPAIHQARGQAGYGLVGALGEHLVPDGLGERDAVVDARRPLAVEQVGGVHGVAAGAQLIGKRAYPVGESVQVVEQNHVGHLYTPVIG
jgi:hypothetical protein